MEDYDGLVGIYSNKNNLTLKLEEKYRQKYLDVCIFDDFSQIDLDKLSYLVINLLDLKRDIKLLSNILRNVTCKVLVVHPLFVKTSEKFVADSDLNELLNTNSNLGIILVPDLLGKNVDFNENSVSHKLIMQRLLSDRVKINENNFFINTITTAKLAERIIKDTFSFGISGQILALIGPRKSKRSFVLKFLEVESQNIISTKEEDGVLELYYTASAQVDFSLSLAVKNTINNFKEKTNTQVEESLIPEEVIVENKKTESKRIKFNFKIVYLVVCFSLFLLTLPLVFIALSVLLLYGSYKYSFKNNDFSTQLVKSSQFFSSLAKTTSFGNNFVYDNANIVYEVSDIGLEGVNLSRDVKDLVLKIMSDSDYEMSAYSNNISASLEKIHTQISFLQSDINDLGGITGNLVKNFLFKKNLDIGEYKNDLYYVKALFSRISTLLGQNEPKKYLVLFQNNMEIRPTGGFIGSFGLFTFDKGRLTDISINDVYTADGQLKGHVDPPDPIRKYLGEGGWYLRDSNWNPNFPDSAVKAEWFLDKELGEQVDGVLAVDLYFIKKILSVTGPIVLNDVGLTINESNMYTLIQNEVEENFFPGSTRKATILTSLSRSLITEIENLDSLKYINLFKEIYDSLERKHILIYLHDKNAQEAVSNLQYSGEYNMTQSCGSRCVRDSYSLIDANLGVNKSNFHLKRSQDIKVTVTKEFVGHELIVTYENTANPGIGNSGIYENYARVLLPVGSVIGGVRLYETDGSYKDLEYDLIDTDNRREVGFVVEVLPGTTKRLQIAWNILDSSLQTGGEYNLVVFKQPGTNEDQLSVQVDSTDLILTGRKISKYNTNLSKDFRARLYYKTYEN